MDALFTLDYNKFMDELVPGEDLTHAELNEVGDLRVLMAPEGCEFDGPATRSALVSYTH